MLTLLLTACANLPGWLKDISVLGLHVSISGFLNTWGYVAVFLFIGIESTGIPFPGETMLVSASVYAAQGCSLQEPYVILACILGAITGDNLGFWVGRTGGRGLIRKYGKYVRVNESHLDTAESYFKRFGGATVFFGRFLAILRAWAAFLAGVNRMQPLRFFIYNATGAILWSTTFGLIGYTLGKNLDKLKMVITTLGTAGAIVVVVIAVVLVGTIWYRSRRNRHAAHVHDGQDTGSAPPPDAGSPSKATGPAAEYAAPHGSTPTAPLSRTALAGPAPNGDTPTVPLSRTAAAEPAPNGGTPTVPLPKTTPTPSEQ